MLPQEYQNIPLHAAQMGQAELISAHFNEALQLAVPMLSGLPDGRAYGLLFMLNPSGVSPFGPFHVGDVSPNYMDEMDIDHTAFPEFMDIDHPPALYPFTHAGQEPFDITETLAFLPPIHLLSLEEDPNAMDVDDIPPDPVEVHGPHPSHFVIPSAIDPYMEGGNDDQGRALSPEIYTPPEFEVNPTIPSHTTSTLEDDQHESYHPPTSFEPADLQSQVDLQLDDLTGDQTENLEGRNVENLTDSFGSLRIEDPASPKVDELSDEPILTQGLSFADIWSIPSPPPSPLVSYTDLLVVVKARLKAEDAAKKLRPVVNDTPTAVPKSTWTEDTCTEKTRTYVPRTPPSTPPRTRTRHLYSRPATYPQQLYYQERVDPVLLTGWVSQSADKEAAMRHFLKKLPPQSNTLYRSDPSPIQPEATAQFDSSPPPPEEEIEVDEELVFPGAYPIIELEKASCPLFPKHVEPVAHGIMLFFGYVVAITLIFG